MSNSESTAVQSWLTEQVVAAIETGKEVIEAKLWTEANINFEKDSDVVYSLPGENDTLLLHEADGQSVPFLPAWSGAGASVEYKFTGTSVNIYNNVENDSVTNDLRVYLDGELIETVDDRKPFSIVKEGLYTGEHTVKLVSGENSTSVSATQGEEVDVLHLRHPLFKRLKLQVPSPGNRRKGDGRGAYRPR